MFKEDFFYVLPMNKSVTFANAVDSLLALVEGLALVSSACGLTSLTSSVLIFKVGLIIILFQKVVHSVSPYMFIALILCQAFF